jgi:corrinoid protein of di/trimethylamine methyltransferase
MNTELFQAMAQSIIDGEVEVAVDLAKRAIESSIDPLEAINQGFMKGVNYVGEQFSCGEMFLPELVGAGEAMKAVVAVLEPEMAKRGMHREVAGKVVIGTIHGDIHDIGKTLVGTMLSAGGFQVFDLGVDVPVQKFIAKAIEVDADIVGVSSLLTTTMVRQKDVIQAVKEAGLSSRVKVMVGGAPVTRAWVEEIGADGYSEDAVGAVTVARQLMAEMVGESQHVSG